MGPTIDAAFVRFNQNLDELEQQYVTLKLLESRYFKVPKLTGLAHREDFRTRFHPSKSNVKEAIQEVVLLVERIHPPFIAEKKAEEARKAEEQAKHDRLKGSDFDMDFS